MAKQTFTTGQVLTAAQMTSLQQTAMGGGSTTAKTASYVLTAADAGTVIQMNSAGSTTITVNTALFAAGDSVQIQNIGAGTCTITAGTATVTTAGSLALTQWEGGNLYFTSTSASIFFDYFQSGGSSGGMTLLSTTTLSGATTTISSIDQGYIDLYCVITQAQCASAGSFRIAPNGTTTAVFGAGTSYDRTTASTLGVNFTYATQGVSTIKASDSQNGFSFRIDKYSTNYTKKNMLFYGSFLNPSDVWYAVSYGGHVSDGSQITSLVFSNSAGNLTGGTVYLYGVK